MVLSGAKYISNIIIYICYIFIAILMLFLVIFEDDKSGNFLRGDKFFQTLKRTMSRQKRNKRRSVKGSFTSHLDVIKGKNGRTFL